jgi:2-polyprenyl-3-methyl-5-hydroxy-6-metoxy-1,4-benzoquinol methylase
MSIDPLSDAKIIDSWYKNAAPWIVAIEERQIASRNLVTDRAIVDAVGDYDGKNVLDIGCGEGWLTRELTARRMQVVGVDVVPALIDRAKLNCNARFLELTYAEITAGKLTEKFDLVVANFSLLGDESVTGLFAAMRSILTPNGIFIIQTMHPVISCGEAAYVDGWRSGSWAGFSNDFTDPAPWYFRTLATWVNLYRSHGFSIVEIREPIHPQTGKLVSLILIGRLYN